MRSAVSSSSRRENARAILPPELQPIEPHHGSSVLSVMAFDFTHSAVGDYGELVLVDDRRARSGAASRCRVRRSIPFRVGTTTRASRLHAIERWHLPHYMQDIRIRWVRGDGRHMHVHAHRPAASRSSTSTISAHEWSNVNHLYQAFMNDEEGAFTSDIIMASEFSENEEERGGIEIHPQAMCDPLARLPMWHLQALPRAVDEERLADLPPAADARESTRSPMSAKVHRHRQPRRRTGAGREDGGARAPRVRGSSASLTFVSPPRSARSRRSRRRR